MTDNWSYNDVPISKFKVKAEPDTVTGEIKVITNIAGKIREQFLQTYNEQVGIALEELGWSSPDMTKAMTEQIKIAVKYIHPVDMNAYTDEIMELNRSAGNPDIKKDS
jgi:hypothetical protein